VILGGCSPRELCGNLALISYATERNVSHVTAAAEQAILDPFVRESLREVAKGLAAVVPRRCPPQHPMATLREILRDQPSAEKPLVGTIGRKRLTYGKNPGVQGATVAP